MKKKTTLTYTWKEIQKLIEKEEGVKLKVEYFDIVKKGDPDRGDYSEELNNVEFEVILS